MDQNYFILKVMNQIQISDSKFHFQKFIKMDLESYFLDLINYYINHYSRIFNFMEYYNFIIQDNSNIFIINFDTILDLHSASSF
jgi:hypothetical protein